MRRMLVVIAVLATVSGCATTSALTLVTPGIVTVGSVTLQADAGWNAVSPYYAGYLRKGSASWTRDGVLLNRIIVVPNTADGETLFNEPKKSAVHPKFRADMLPHEIAAFVESSLTKIGGEGETLATTSNLRPAKFGDAQGIMFDVSLSFADGADYRGVAGAFVTNGQLSFVTYIAAHPYYFDRDLARGEAIVASTRRVEA